MELEIASIMLAKFFYGSLVLVITSACIFGAFAAKAMYPRYARIVYGVCGLWTVCLYNIIMSLDY